MAARSRGPPPPRQSGPGSSRAAAGPLTFTEPNLVFTLVAAAAGSGTVAVDLDQEFRLPWNRNTGAPPFTLTVTTDPRQLRAAADAWDDQRRPYPDLYPYPEDYSGPRGD